MPIELIIITRHGNDPKRGWKEGFREGWKQGYSEGYRTGRQEERMRRVAWNRRREVALQEGEEFT